MELIYQLCFYMGIGMLVVLFLFKTLFHAFRINRRNSNFKPISFNIFLAIKPIKYILFTTIFGGVGWILIDYHTTFGNVITAIIAIVTGIIISSLVYYIVIKPLNSTKDIKFPDAEDLVGVRATVIESITAGGFGEIHYNINGSSFRSPSKATNGTLIKSGKDVVICWIENHIFYVASIDDR